MDADKIAYLQSLWPMFVFLVFVALMATLPDGTRASRERIG